MPTVMYRKAENFYRDLKTIVSTARKSMDFNQINLEYIFKKQLFMSMREAGTKCEP